VNIFYCAYIKVTFVCILKRETFVCILKCETRQNYFDIWKKILLPKKYQASAAPQQPVFLPHHGPNSGLAKTNKASEREMNCHSSSSPFFLPHTNIVVPQFQNSLVEMYHAAEVGSPSYIIVNASDGKDFHIFMPFANVYQVTVNPVEAIVAGNIKSLEEMSRHAPEVVSWLKQNLSLAHTDKNINSMIKAVLGAPRFASNLEYFQLWDDLIEDCKRQALEIGQGMKRYYDTNELSVVLGEKAIPNTFGKCQMRAGENQFVVERCSQQECARRQDEAMHPPDSGIFPQNVAHSQVWNEKCFIHVLRMVAMAIDLMYQEIVQKICEDCNGSFRNTEIKGFVRMKNKCVSKEDHYFEAYPRSRTNGHF
jgi:hypothetical protein